MTPSPDIQYRALQLAVEECPNIIHSLGQPKEWIKTRAAEIAATLPQAVSPQAVQVTDAMIKTALDAYYGDYPWDEQDEDECPTEETFRSDMRRALEAAIAAQPQAQPPQDYVLVPRTPTYEMLRAAQSTNNESTSHKWHAMLDAAPKPQESPAQSGTLEERLSQDTQLSGPAQSDSPSAKDYATSQLHRVQRSIEDGEFHGMSKIRSEDLQNEKEILQFYLAHAPAQSEPVTWTVWQVGYGAEEGMIGIRSPNGSSMLLDPEDDLLRDMLVDIAEASTEGRIYTHPPAPSPASAASSQRALVEAVCEWYQDSDGTWQTQCGHEFQFIDDGPEENQAFFCLYCGGKLKPSRFTDDDEEDTAALDTAGRGEDAGHSDARADFNDDLAHGRDT